MNEPAAHALVLRLSDGRSLDLVVGRTFSAPDLPGLHSLPPGGPVAAVTSHPTEPAICGMQNLSQRSWRARLANGDSTEVKPGRNIRLAQGTRINFGSVEGEIEHASQPATGRSKTGVWIGIGIAGLCLVLLGGWYLEQRFAAAHRQQIARQEQQIREEAQKREKERAEAEARKREQEVAAEIHREAAELKKKAEEAALARAAAASASASAPAFSPTPSLQFDGTWKGRHWLPPKPKYRLVGSWFYDTLVLRNGSNATFTEENTSELQPDSDHWFDMPAPYNKTRQHFRKFRAESERVIVTDTSIEISLGEWQLVEWKPKNYPVEAFLGTPYPKFRNVSLNVKSENELAISWLDGGEEVLRRVK